MRAFSLMSASRERKFLHRSTRLSQAGALNIAAEHLLGCQTRADLSLDRRSETLPVPGALCALSPGLLE